MLLVVGGPNPMAGSDASHSSKFILAVGIGEGSTAEAANGGSSNDGSMAPLGVGLNGDGRRLSKEGPVWGGGSDGERNENAPGADASVLNETVNPGSKV